MSKHRRKLVIAEEKDGIVRKRRTLEEKSAIVLGPQAMEENLITLLATRSLGRFEEGVPEVS